MVALVWGLLSDRPGARWVAGLAGFGALVNEGAAGLLLWYLQGNADFAASLRRAVEQDLATVVVALENYRERWREYPRELSLLNRGALASTTINVTDRSRGLYATRHPYQYRRSADGGTYDLFGVGPDGQAGTADDVRPVLPDSLARRSGYRPTHPDAP